MKKVITMVGTSIFENCKKNMSNNSNFENYYKDLKDKKSEEYDSEKSRVDFIKKLVEDWINKEHDKQNVSAEIKSLEKIRKELDEEISVYLLTSDTVIGKLAGEVVESIIKSLGISNNVTQYTIEGLQVENRKEFGRGMVNLIYKIYEITDGYWENVIINITGGFKASIPYLTILAQVNKVPIYYIFEDTNALMKIPYIPIDIKWSVFEKNEEFFLNIEKEKIKELTDKVKNNSDIQSLLEVVEDYYCLNPLGIALWEKYREKFEIFYVSEEVKDYLEKNKSFKKIFEKSVLELMKKLKENPNHPDLHHPLQEVNLPEGFKVFKHIEGSHQVRILYKSDKYKTRYGSDKNLVYIGLFLVGSDVHDSGNEYVNYFDQKANAVLDTNKYSPEKINKEV